jgi:hypothetical protein
MQKIIVKNFRQITYAEIEIKDIVFLIGEQASGKSTIAKLIYFFKSLKEVYFNLILENKNNDIDVIDLFGKKIRSLLNQFIYGGSHLSEDFELIFYYNYVSEKSSKNRCISIKRENKALVDFDDAYYSDFLNDLIQQRATKQFILNTGDRNLIEREKTIFVNDLIKRTNDLFFDDAQLMFFPAGRSITVSYPEQFQSLFLGNLYASTKESYDMTLMKSFISYSKFLLDQFLGSNFDLKSTETQNIEILDFFKRNAAYILKGKYLNENGQERILFKSSSNVNSVPLNVASSGQQESVRIIQDLFYILSENKKEFRVIEEPEAHLYPEAQKKLIELFSLVVNKTDSQFVITSHSPYILSIVNNLLMYSLVCKNNPSAKNKIEDHFGINALNLAQNERINLNSTQVQAYSLSLNSENYCTSIIDAETGLIGDNYLDAVTEQLNNDFNVLYHLNFQNAETNV